METEYDVWCSPIALRIRVSNDHRSIVDRRGVHHGRGTRLGTLMLLVPLEIGAACLSPVYQPPRIRHRPLASSKWALQLNMHRVVPAGAYGACHVYWLHSYTRAAGGLLPTLAVRMRSAWALPFGQGCPPHQVAAGVSALCRGHCTLRRRVVGERTPYNRVRQASPAGAMFPLSGHRTEGRAGSAGLSLCHHQLMQGRLLASNSLFG